MAMTSDWTDERVAEASRLWVVGKTADEISRLIGGCTRNAVVGKLHRVGLKGKGGSRANAVPSGRGRRAIAAPHAIIPRTAWTVDDDHELEFLLATGMTSRRIGSEIGRSYDAVKRRVAELGLTRPVVEAREPRRSAKNGMQVVHMATAAKMVERFKCEAEEPAPDGGVTIIELKSRHCRWPFGEPRDFETFRYCGADRESDAGPYCHFHFLAALTPEGRARHEVRARHAHLHAYAREEAI